MNTRFVVEHFARERNIGLGIADIARARRLIFRLDFLSRYLLKQQQDLIDRNPGTRSAIEDFSHGVFFLASDATFRPRYFRYT